MYSWISLYVSMVWNASLLCGQTMTGALTVRSLTSSFLLTHFLVAQKETTHDPLSRPCSNSKVARGEAELLSLNVFLDCSWSLSWEIRLNAVGPVWAMPVLYNSVCAMITSMQSCVKCHTSSIECDSAIIFSFLYIFLCTVLKISEKCDSMVQKWT